MRQKWLSLPLVCLIPKTTSTLEILFVTACASQSAQAALEEGDLHLICRQTRRRSSSTGRRGGGPLLPGLLGPAATGSKKQDLQCAGQFWVSGRRGEQAGILAQKTQAPATLRLCPRVQATLQQNSFLPLPALLHQPVSALNCFAGAYGLPWQ